MTKKQKIWLYIFLALFVIPEVLWSPVGNFVYELFLSHYGSTRPFRNNFLQQSNNINYLSTILFLQLLGIFSTFIYLIITRKNITKIPFWLSILATLLLSIITFFCFGLSISLRHFGF